jgi:hypothetical protein
MNGHRRRWVLLCAAALTSVAVLTPPRDGDLPLLAYPLFAAYAFVLSLSCPLVPLPGFTFHRHENLYALGLLAALLTALVVRHFHRPYPGWWPRAAAFSLYAVTLLAPLAFWLSLLALWLRARVLIGHNPRPMWDDPKGVCHGDTICRSLYQGVDYATAFSGVCLWLALALSLHLLSTRLLDWRRFALVGAMAVVGWLTFVSEPLRLFEWWLD